MMTGEELQRWLEEQGDTIASFMDYDPTIQTEEELEQTLQSWFDSERWDAGGHRFLHLGSDNTGGEFALWLRPDEPLEPPPVVYFGSEGGSGVLVASPQSWALALAYAPGVEELAGQDDPAYIDVELGWMADPEEDPEWFEEAQGALQEYRAAAEERFDDIPSFASLTQGIEDLNADFLTWTTQRLGL